jgi:hypothetical protein
MYEINGRKFDSYLAAIANARAIGAEVFQVNADGSKTRRWAPATAPAAKKVRQYRERCAAYAAQQNAR